MVIEITNLDSIEREFLDTETGRRTTAPCGLAQTQKPTVEEPVKMDEFNVPIFLMQMETMELL